MSASYHKEITVNNTATAAFQALTSGFNQWWTTNCNPVDKVNDLVTFHFGEAYWVMRVSKLETDHCVELECVEANHVHDGLPSSIKNEWLGTKLHWRIKEQENKTLIQFEHLGLEASLECYEVCEQGWDYFFLHSLKDYLDSGKGNPFTSDKN